MIRDLSLVEPDLTDLLILGMLLIGGEENYAYWLYSIDLERVPLIDWLHRN